MFFMDYLSKKINLKAVIVGTVADLLATFLFGILFLFLFGHEDTVLPYFLILGLVCITVGGYVAASLSQSDKVFNATMV